jgi:hypothetical protein
MVNRYLKFIAEIVFAILAAIVAANTDNVVDGSEWINVVIVALGAVAVLGAGNLPAGVWAYTKTIVAAATAAAVFLQSAITDGVSTSEWLQLALAILGALGVAVVPGPRVRAIRGPGAQVDGVADHAA